ncbi:hypothetical protein SASPL_146826 [Salvia splendens]|uniref:WEB family protein n=1 Tax=Salvia splendens TaxID=180675 RepID=A0A8X8WCV2_SALSN|nr:hypothetical protein SASPL_146826 [Salvia splendens]
MKIEETALVKAEIQKSEAEIDMAEERLQAALQDLKAAKSSEAMALENLKSIIDKTVRNRASASRPSSTITISKFEYLKGNASEKEFQIKAELFKRETRALRVEEGHRLMEPEKLPPDGKAMKKALKGHQQDEEWFGNLHLQWFIVLLDQLRSQLGLGRRRKMMPSLAKFFSGKPVESNLQPTWKLHQ